MNLSIVSFSFSFSHFSFPHLLNIVQNDEVSDTTGDDSSNAADHIKNLNKNIHASSHAEMPAL
jgi:hypothetical protein